MAWWACRCLVARAPALRPAAALLTCAQVIRQEKLHAQEQEHEARVKRALERAAAPVFKKAGKCSGQALPCQQPWLHASHSKAHWLQQCIRRLGECPLP